MAGVTFQQSMSIVKYVLIVSISIDCSRYMYEHKHVVHQSDTLPILHWISLYHTLDTKDGLQMKH